MKFIYIKKIYDELDGIEIIEAKNKEDFYYRKDIECDFLESGLLLELEEAQELSKLLIEKLNEVKLCKE